jgi:hypothetical protein
MALQALTQKEIDAVSGGCDAGCKVVEPPIEVEAPGLYVGLDPLVLVNGVLGVVGGVISGLKHKLLACVI